MPNPKPSKSKSLKNANPSPTTSSPSHSNKHPTIECHSDIRMAFTPHHLLNPSWKSASLNSLIWIFLLPPHQGEGGEDVLLTMIQRPQSSGSCDSCQKIRSSKRRRKTNHRLAPPEFQAPPASPSTKHPRFPPQNPHFQPHSKPEIIPSSPSPFKNPLKQALNLNFQPCPHSMQPQPTYYTRTNDKID